MAHHLDEYKEKQGLKFSLLYLFVRSSQRSGRNFNFYTFYSFYDPASYFVRIRI